MEISRNYPIILGNKPDGRYTKMMVGAVTPGGHSMDLYILGLKDGAGLDDNTSNWQEEWDGRIYAQLRFCGMEALDKTIEQLQKMKTEWKQSEQSDSSCIKNPEEIHTQMEDFELRR